VIERDAFRYCSSTELVSVPASAQVIDLPLGVSISRSCDQSLPE
jgi:hypothetical protein